MAMMNVVTIAGNVGISVADDVHLVQRSAIAQCSYSSDEPGELSQWLCHDDSIINTVVQSLLTLLLIRDN